MRLQKIVLEYPDGHLESIPHHASLVGISSTKHGGRPTNIYLPQAAGSVTFKAAHYAVHPLEGKVHFMKADFDGDLETFKMNRLLGLI